MGHEDRHLLEGRGPLPPEAGRSQELQNEGLRALRRLGVDLVDKGRDAPGEERGRRVRAVGGGAERLPAQQEVRQLGEAEAVAPVLRLGDRAVELGRIEHRHGRLRLRRSEEVPQPKLQDAEGVLIIVIIIIIIIIISLSLLVLSLSLSSSSSS